jgi:hypothetical protein
LFAAAEARALAFSAFRSAAKSMKALTVLSNEDDGAERLSRKASSAADPCER